MAKNNTYDADSITVLEGLEAVRKRPGMYIGSVSTKGLNHLIYEIVDNAVDEHLAGFCTEIHVTLEKDGSATISDNGRGVPVGMHAKGVSAERIVYTTLHASPWAPASGPVCRPAGRSPGTPTFCRTDCCSVPAP